MARNMRIKQSLVLLSQVLKNCCINAACFCLSYCLFVTKIVFVRVFVTTVSRLCTALLFCQHCAPNEMEEER